MARARNGADRRTGSNFRCRHRRRGPRRPFDASAFGGQAGASARIENYQFDAVLHFDETRAVKSLESTAEWETGELPETFPFAV
jgi:hypothetical protein